MTPCEEKGYKIGDEFVVTEDHWNAKKGEKLTLLDDDGTSLPYFEKHTKGGDERYFPHLNWVEKVTTGGETITRTNGQPFATEASARQQLTAKGLQGTHEVVSHGGGYALVPKQPEAKPEPATTPSPITTLLTARKARNEAEAAYQAALEAVRNELPGYVLAEVGKDAPLVDGADMTEPANWQEG